MKAPPHNFADPFLAGSIRRTKHVERSRHAGARAAYVNASDFFWGSRDGKADNIELIWETVCMVCVLGWGSTIHFWKQKDD